MSPTNWCPPPLSPRQARRRGSDYSRFPPPRSTTRWRPFTPPSSARRQLTLALRLLLARCPLCTRTPPGSTRAQVSPSGPPPARAMQSWPAHFLPTPFLSRATRCVRVPKVLIFPRHVLGLWVTDTGPPSTEGQKARGQ